MWETGGHYRLSALIRSTRDVDYSHAIVRLPLVALFPLLNPGHIFEPLLMNYEIGFAI